MSENGVTPEAAPVERPALSQTSIVVLRVLLLLVAAGAVLAAFLVVFHGPTGGDPNARYLCPMHPEVRAPGPGECPICRMALEPIARASSASGKSGENPETSDMLAFENVRKHKIVDFARVRSLLPNLHETRGPAWTENEQEVSAVFYQDQIDALGPEEPGTFSLSASPATVASVTRIPGAAVPWDRSTSRIRFRIAQIRGNRAESLRAGQAGWVKVASKPRTVLTVPYSAVLQAPEGPYVLAWVGAGFRFEKRPIEIGEMFARQEFVVVLSGLRPNDQVVKRATFFVDADRRLGDVYASWSTP